MSTYTDASLILYPSGYKEDKIYSLKPTDGSGDLTFTRASTATRVNAEGLIEKVRTNLLTYSNDFTTSWILTGSGSSLGSDVAGPIAGVTGKALTMVAGSLLYKNITSIPLGVMSVYMRVSSGTIDLQLGDPLGSPYSTKTLTTTWQRFSTVDTGSLGGLAIYNSISGTTINIEIAAAQVELSDIATEYIPTTTTAVSVGMLANVPRIDYTGGGCGKLLLEPQRTNLLTYSEQIDNAVWSKYLTTISPNNATSPDGTQNADMATSDAGGDLKNILNVATSTAYTFSFYVKRGTVADAKYRVYNFDTGTNIVAPTSYISQTNTSTWVRISVSFTSSATGASYGFYLLDQASAGTMYFWGAQLEASSFPTSYIPCPSSSSVTRAQDSASKSGISSLINSEEGVLYFEGSAFADDFVDKRISISDGTLNNYVSIGYSRFSGNIVGEIFSGGVSQVANWGATGVTKTNNNKFALSWGSGTMKFYSNGTQTNTESVTSPTGMNALKFSAGNNSLTMVANVQNLMVFPSALTDEQLADLTGESHTTFNSLATFYGYQIL